MQRPLLLLALVGLAIIGGVSLAGYYLGQLAENRNQPEVSPSPSVTPSSTPTPIPSPTPSEAPSPSPTAAPRVRKPLPTAPAPRSTPKPQVQGLSTFPSTLPTIGPSQTSGGSNTGDNNQDSADLRVRFINLPSQVQSGQSFTITWRVEGKSGSSVSTTLDTSLSSSSGGASSSSSSSTTFKSGTVPQEFSTRVSFGGSPGTIRLHAHAEQGGRTASADASVELTN